MTKPFWKEKPLDALDDAEWESLCDGCGKCCLAKLEDADTGEIHWTSVGCRLFDESKCRCTDYENRQKRVSDCVRLTPDNVAAISWLPGTCAYRLIAEGRDLAWWHPLVSGRAETVHEAGISMRGRLTGLENDMADEEDYLDHILEGGTMTDDTVALVKRFLEALNAGDAQQALLCLHEDVAHDIGPDRREIGHDPFRRFVAERARDFDETMGDIVIMTGENGRRAAAEFTLRGRAAGGDRESYSLSAGMFFQIEDGLVVRVTRCRAGLAMQG